MTKITNSVIADLKPCSDRHNNYLKYYANTSLTPRQFMGRKNITQSDKMWVAFRMLPKEIIGKVAAEIAMSVLHIYEKQYPNDNRVRDCIEATLNGTVTREQRNAAAASAATDATIAAAAAAATAASAATIAAADAASAADAATYAAYAASADYAAYARAAATDAAVAAASAADAAVAAARSKQEKLIRTIILRYWK